MDAKQRALSLHLNPPATQNVAASEIEWGMASPHRFRPCHTWQEYREEVRSQASAFPNDEAEARVLRAHTMYAGVHPEDGSARHFTVHRTFSPQVIHPAVQLVLAGRSAKIRAIPASWQNNVHLRTPIIATARDETTMDLWFEELNGERYPLGETRVLAPVTPTPLAYKAGEIVVINPVQICQLKCDFCIHEHIQTREFGIANFTAGETAEYLVDLYGATGWESVPLVKFITGAFSTYGRLLQYMRGFTLRMKELTDGGFDPITNSRQKIHMLTNLVSTREEMEEFKAHGVGSLEHTVEIIDNARRRRHMSRASARGRTPGKGEVSFEQMVEMARIGSQVYGEDYAVGIVLGMDDLRTTVRGLKELHKAGVQKATSGIFIPNAYHEVHLQQMTFSEIMEARRASAQLFELPYIFARHEKDGVIRG